MENFKILSYAVPMLAVAFILISPSKFRLQTGNIIHKQGK